MDTHSIRAVPWRNPMSRQPYHTARPLRLQAEPLITDLWTDEVLPHLPPDLETQAHHLGAFQRRRGLASATDLLRSLLAAVLVTTSFRHLGAWAVLAGVADISAPAWHKRLVRARPWLQWLLSTLLAATPLPRQRNLPSRPTILLVDATTLGQPGGTGDDWRLHMAYDFTAGRLAQVTITDQSGGEQMRYYHLRPGDIGVTDGAYGYRRSVATMRKQQAHLVARIYPATFPVETDAGHVLDVVAQLRKRGEAVRVWTGWCRDADGEQYRVRVIAAKLPPAAAAAARARARRNAQRHGRTVQPATLLLAGWILLVTTLPAATWDAADVLRLYRVRWQIELLFKRMKSIMALGHLRGRTAASLEAQILALLIAWVLQDAEAAWMRRMVTQLERQWQDGTVIGSSWSLTTLRVDLLRQQVRGGWGQARVAACLVRLQRFLTSRWRHDRDHQETVLRDWLARRPVPSLVIRQTAACGMVDGNIP